MKVALSPLDTLFFRDSAPFSQGDDSQSGIIGLFPPNPETIAGALRAALAREMGWDGKSRWGEDIVRVLGSGSGNLGLFDLESYCLLQGNHVLLPCPAHVVRGLNDEKISLTRLTEKPIQTDMGLKHFPQPGKPPGDWVTEAAFCEILAGRVPEDSGVLQSDALWSKEYRVGIQRDTKLRTAQEGALYSTVHARLHDAPSNKQIRIAVTVGGLSDTLGLQAGSIIPLGGESRAVIVEPWAGDLSFPRVKLSGGAAFVLIAITPALLGTGILAGTDDVLIVNGIAVQIQSIASNRELRIGGWDSTAKQPRPLRNALVPGSVLFCKATSDFEVPTGLVRLGSDCNAGYGLFVIGHTP